MSKKQGTLLAVILGSATVFLESSVVAAALPKIGNELSSTWLRTLEAQSFVYYAYLLALSSLLIVAGALTDYHGRRRMFFLGLAGFGVTSALCGLAPNMEFLIVARVLQGASGAVLVPGSLSIITATFEGEEQGRAFGIWAGASAATTILGPVVGGALVAYVSWRAAFFVGIPFILISAWATLKFMDESRDEEASGRVDLRGAFIVALAVGGLTFGAIRGQAQEWQEVGPFISLAIGAVAAIWFPFAMRKSDNPLVPLELFRSRNFNITNISTLLIYASIYVTIQFMALYLVGVVGYNEISFGLSTIPSTVFLALFSTRFGRLADRHGPRRYMAIGPAIMGFGLLWFARMPADSAGWTLDLRDPETFVPPASYLTDVLPAMLVFGIGLMVMVAPLTTALMRSVPVRHSGVASAFNNAVSRVGPQLGGAAIFIFISATFYASLQAQIPQVNLSSPQVHELVSPLNPPPEEAGPELRDASVRASNDAFRVAMSLAALMCLIGAAVNGAGIVNPKRSEGERLEPDPEPAPGPGT